ncbi:hypothetical protein L4X63_09475 [Geomonas sp. Red32]|uniref:hypothetical protein n=1 Tax=Geomonas sp. Red32 TaxID=2912856 RepID=UPI00202CA9A1|nr:hypothetical protein [Geomonas sp. Red32]MCM0081818.1 hypothetical protein [Geomonas sp. Red32]
MRNRFVLGASLGLCIALGGCDNYKPSPGPEQSKSSGSSTPELLKDPDYLKAVKKAEQHVETKKEYIASTQKVGGKKDAIYLKEFLKNPGKFHGTRIGVLGKILQIEESGGHTGIQMYVDNRLDSVLVQYPGSIKAYEGDVVMVYGEGAGTMDGQNRMGASITLPIIEAKYITIRQRGDD